MARAKLSDQATEADWRFLEVEGLYARLEARAGVIGARWPDVDPDDLLQEALLALSVRPAAVAADLAKPDGVALLVFRAQGFMTTRATTEQHYVDTNPSYEGMTEGDDGGHQA